MNYLQIIIALYTIVRREWVRTFRIWVGTLLPPVVTTLLYFLIFGHVIGQRVGHLDGHPYIEFIAPGLIIMAIINHAYSCSVSAFFGMKFHRDIDEILITPMPVWVLIAGFVCAGMLRGIIVGVLVSTVALFFVHFSVHSFLWLLISALLSSAIFSLAGVINAIFARTFDHISLIPTFILTPLTYLGGVFYSVRLLPGFWRTLSTVNPIYYIISSFRYALLGTTGGSTLITGSMLVLIFGLLFVWCHYLIYRSPWIKK